MLNSGSVCFLAVLISTLSPVLRPVISVTLPNEVPLTITSVISYPSSAVIVALVPFNVRSALVPSPAIISGFWVGL